MRNRIVWLALFTFVLASAGTAFADHLCAAEADKGAANGTYVQKKNGVIKKRFRITGERSYVLVEKLDLDDGSVVRKSAWVWTSVTPPQVAFSKANKNQMRLKEATKDAPPSQNITITVFDKDCTTIKTITWEKE